MFTLIHFRKFEFSTFSNIYNSFSSIFFISYNQECSLDIQRETEEANVAIKAFIFLKEYSVCSPTITYPIKTVLKKWIDKKDIDQGLLYKSGPFYDFMREQIQSEQTPALSANHQYSVGNSIPSYTKFSVASDSETFNVLDFEKFLSR